VRQWQTLFYDKRYYQTTLDRGPDFVKLADAYGVEGHRIDTLPQFEAQLEKAVNAGRPVLLDCRIDIDAKVSPMVGPGRPITDFVLK
jgi:acetolactate synthase-1/2/3 large subunit